MQHRSAEIAIIGAGPAGAHLASRLASEGRDVVLFDPKGAWEKPCGGGVPTRAIREFAFILESSQYPRKLVRQITMISPLERRVTLTLDRPFAVYSRQVLNGLVLDRAIEAGAEFVREGVSDFSREPDGWTISTDSGSQWRVKFLVGADGAASSTRRRLIGIFPKRDLALAFGYNIASEEAEANISTNGELQTASAQPSDVVIMRFPKNVSGYLWAFPRPGMMNFGVASKLGQCTSSELRELLQAFVSEYYGGCWPDPHRASFFGAKIPILDQRSWEKLRASGDDWALVGDAAGFVDPITGEGIYYALKSSDLLADVIASGRRLPRSLGKSSESRIASERYEESWRQAFGGELERASQMQGRFYNGYFLGMLFPEAMILVARYHRGVRTVLMRLIVGEQSYVTLKRDLLRQALKVF